MELLNLILASVERMGYSHLTLELFSAAILIFIYLGVRRINKFQKIVLDKLDKHHDEMDPAHMYSKLNRFEDNLDAHQHEETRLLHDVSTNVVKIDTKLDTIKLCKED
jgi:hypothetical protein